MMKLTKNAIKEIEASNLRDGLKRKLIENNGDVDEFHYYGKYKNFELFQSDVDEDSFALNEEFYKKEGYNINSYDGIEEVKQYIDEEYL